MNILIALVICFFLLLFIKIFSSLIGSIFLFIGKLLKFFWVFIIKFSFLSLKGYLNDIKYTSKRNKFADRISKKIRDNKFI